MRSSVRRAGARELEALARAGFADLPRDGLVASEHRFAREVVAYLDDAPRAELLYDLLLPYADRCVVVFGVFCQGSASRPLGSLATTMGA